VEIRGFLAKDTSDPRDRIRERVEALGIPSAGLIAQRHLEDRGEAGLAASLHGAEGAPQVLQEATISRTYVLWRNPEDVDDPVNLRDGAEASGAADRWPAARPKPPWMDELRRMLRYPRLWEAVQTHWARPGVDHPPLPERLIAHAEYVLTNRFREQLGIGTGPGAWAPRIPPAALQSHHVLVDGAAREGLLLDTDPHVVAVGCELDDARVVTVVVPRDALPLLRLELESAAPIVSAPVSS
jgi:hypothetical protein